jgi:uncharacterized membrane protein HdeD (DUF308 family)
MKLELPPVLFYGVGVILIVFGALRAYHLGWVRREAPSPDRVEGDEVDTTPRTDPTARRHMMFGLLWVVMGIILVVSTYMNSRR